MNDSIGLIYGLLAVVVLAAVYVWTALALSALFRKAGEAGWQAWVPYYNIAILLTLGGFSPWMVLIGLVPIFGLIALPVIFFIACHRIGRAFGFGGGMTAIAVFFFLVWASIIGFGSARWIGAARSSGPSPAWPDGEVPPPLTGAPLREWTPLLAPSDAAPAAYPAPAYPAPAYPAAAQAPLHPAPAPAGAWAPAAPPTVDAAAALGSPPEAAPRRAASEFSSEPAAPAAAPSAALTGFDADDEDSAVDPEDRVAPVAQPSGSFLPPAPDAFAAPAPAPSSASFSPIETVPVSHVDEAAQPTPAPVSRVPEAPEPAPQPEPWVPAPAPERSLRAPESDAFPELSEAVSAVVGAPDAGAPRSARSSVSALYAQAEVPDDDDAIDQTVIARRRRIPWALIPPGGQPIDISSEVVILGRRPAPDPAHPGAQLIAISDDTRTVSKTHARLRLREDIWYVTDLDSTNGVLFATLMGTEVEAPPGQELEAGEKFFLGDAEVRLKRGSA